MYGLNTTSDKHATKVKRWRSSLAPWLNFISKSRLFTRKFQQDYDTLFVDKGCMFFVSFSQTSNVMVTSPQHSETRKCAADVWVTLSKHIRQSYLKRLANRADHRVNYGTEMRKIPYYIHFFRCKKSVKKKWKLKKISKRIISLAVLLLIFIMFQSQCPYNLGSNAFLHLLKNKLLRTDS